MKINLSLVPLFVPNVLPVDSYFTFCSALSMYPIDDLSSFVGILDTICLFAFVFELSVRVGFHSWWVGPDAVLRDPWALLDVYLVASHGVTTTATVRHGAKLGGASPHAIMYMRNA